MSPGGGRAGPGVVVCVPHGAWTGDILAGDLGRRQSGQAEPYEHLEPVRCLTPAGAGVDVGRFLSPAKQVSSSYPSIGLLSRPAAVYARQAGA